MGIYLSPPSGTHEIDVGSGVKLTCRHLDHETQTRCYLEADAAVEAARKLDDTISPVAAGVMRITARLRALGHALIEGWSGVVDPETGEAAKVTPETIDALLQNPSIAVAFQLGADAGPRLVDEEKNASGPSLNGTGATGRDTAETALN